MDDPPLLWEGSAVPTVREYLAALQDVMIAVQDPGTVRGIVHAMVHKKDC